MDGHALARTLTPPVSARPKARRSSQERFTLAVAQAQDDAAIRRMLRETAFPGSVSLSFEREPDSLAAATVEGDVHHILVARDNDAGSLAAIASRSSRERFVNGTPARVGYLGQLRMAPDAIHRRALLDQGFAFCRELHERDPVQLYLASVVAGNTAAMRLLERGRREWPAFRRIDDLVTLAIPAGGGAGGISRVVDIARGGTADAPALAAILARNNHRCQFAPCWTDDDLLSPVRTRGLALTDFLLATRHGRLAGCAALWDQRAFKQVVVRAYSPALDWGRPLINLLRPLRGDPPLPPAGSQLSFAHVSHLAVDDDDPELAVSLVAAARRRAREAGLQYLTLGLSSRNPVLRHLRRSLPHRIYRSVLFVGFWPDGRAAADLLDGRPAHPEMAVL